MAAGGWLLVSDAISGCLVVGNLKFRDHTLYMWRPDVMCLIYGDQRLFIYEV